MISEATTDWHLRQAARALHAGGLVVHATEGVWGLACDPFNKEAVATLLAVKQRSVDKGLIVIAADAEAFAPELSALSQAEQAEVKASWPGPVTWLLATDRYPHWITGGRPKVALRVPGHEQARELCRCYGGTLVSTSANLAGRPSARNIYQAAAFASRQREVSYLLPGETLADSSGPSQIRELDGRVLR